MSFVDQPRTASQGQRCHVKGWKPYMLLQSASDEQKPDQPLVTAPAAAALTASQNHD
jgi:hypothetical protein